MSYLFIITRFYFRISTWCVLGKHQNRDDIFSEIYWFFLPCQGTDERKVL